MDYSSLAGNAQSHLRMLILFPNTQVILCDNHERNFDDRALKILGVAKYSISY